MLKKEPHRNVPSLLYLCSTIYYRPMNRPMSVMSTHTFYNTKAVSGEGWIGKRKRIMIFWSYLQQQVYTRTWSVDSTSHVIPVQVYLHIPTPRRVPSGDCQPIENTRHFFCVFFRCASIMVMLNTRTQKTILAECISRPKFEKSKGEVKEKATLKEKDVQSYTI